MMPGFEGAFKHLHGFNFADDRSRENALWATLWALNAHSNCGIPPRPPMVLISGPQGSGKNALAVRIGEQSECVDSPTTQRDLRVQFSDWAQKRVVCIDGFEPRLFKSGELARFITSEAYQFRKLGETKMRFARLRCLLIAVMYGEYTLPPDMVRRVVEIKLGGRPGI